MKHRNENTCAINTPQGITRPGDTIKQVIFGTHKINVPLGIVAIVMLVASLSVFAYTTMNKEDTDKITVNGKDYAWDDIFDDFETTALDGHEGILLSELVNDTGLKSPESHEYKVRGADGYFKTVSWDDMQNGLLVKEDKMTVFPEKTKGYWIKDVVEIEVV